MFDKEWNRIPRRIARVEFISEDKPNGNIVTKFTITDNYGNIVGGGIGFDPVSMATNVLQTAYELRAGEYEHMKSICSRNKQVNSDDFLKKHGKLELVKAGTGQSLVLKQKPE